MVYTKPELTQLGSAETVVLGVLPDFSENGSSTIGAALEFE
jgi:hypothetical protein